jgi:hypothetical protein
MHAHTNTYLTDRLEMHVHTNTYTHKQTQTPGSNESFGEIRALNELSLQQHRENKTGIYDNRIRTNKKEVCLRESYSMINK